MLVGYHTNIYNSYLETIEYAHRKNHANSIQLFVGNPKSYKSSNIDVTGVKQYVQDNSIFLICHSPYIINFARPNNTQGISRYVSDLNTIESMGGYGSVVHMGYNVLKDENVNRTFIKNLDEVSQSISHNVKMIVENMSGKGTAMCCTMDGWASFNEEIPEDLYKRIEYCVDTAHLYGEGSYNLSMRRESMRFYEDFNNMIGWDKVACFHFNGSHADLGSCKDLHADIGDTMCGVIESKGMRHLARIAHQTHKPLILEVRQDEFPVLWQIETIKSWVDPHHPMHTIFGSTQFV